MSRILFIGLPFYVYTARIADSLRRKGHVVDFHPIEDRSFAAKTFKRVAPSWFTKNRDKYHGAILRAARNVRYDRVIFLQTHHVSHENMARLRKDHAQARFSLYNWDSLTTHDYSSYLKYFDVALTFDRSDAERLGIDYLPLFALPEFFDVKKDRPKKYDLYYVATIASVARFKAAAALHRFCRTNGIRLKLHLRCSPPICALLLSKGLYLKGVSLRSLSSDQVIALLEESQAVFDHPNHPQSGYTMRLIENICAGKKAITSNANIESEPFFSEDRFLLIRDFDFTGIPAFLTRPMTSETSFVDFSLDNWTDRLLK